MNCTSCASYNRGAGTEKCLKCPKYKEIVQQTIGWETHNIVTLPEIMMEAFPDRRHEDHKLDDAMQKLDCLQLAVLVLRKQYGRTVREIAADLSIDKETVVIKTDEAIRTLKIILNITDTDS